MKKNATLFLLIAGILFHLNASANYKQGITISVKDEPLEAVFKIIQKQSSYSFVYSGDQLKGASKVSVSVVNETLKNVLDQVLKGQPLRYEISNEFVIIKKKTTVTQTIIDGDTTAGKPIDLIGKVVDEQGKPVAGATVTVRGSGVSTATNADGDFLIRADERGSLMITSVGFDTKIIRINGANSLVVKLSIVAQQMKEVIISTGYQKVSAERFVGAYSQLDSAAYSRRAGMNILDRLDGTVSGVVFKKKGDLQPIQIRGISTLGGGVESSSLWEPLIVVDNFPMDSRFNINSINPNDVENITILKDAAATSIWGAKAGNGVIVITTKKGRYNKALQVSASINLTIESKPNLFYVPRLTSSEFIDIEKDLYSKGFYENSISDVYSWPVVSPVVEILEAKKNNLISEKEAEEKINQLRRFDTRDEYMKHVYRNAVWQQHYIGIGNGNNVFTYNISGGYNRKINSIKGSNPDQQFTISANTAFKPQKNLEIQTSLNFTESREKSTLLPSLPTYFPYMQLVEQDGTPSPIPYRHRISYLDTVGKGTGLLDWKYRPLDEIKYANNNITSKNLRINLGLSYRIANWVSASFGYQYLTQSTVSKKLNGKETYFTRDLVNTFYNPDPTLDEYHTYPIPKGGILDLSNFESKNHIFRASINVNKVWGQHRISGLIGTDISETNGFVSYIRLFGFNEQNGSYRSTMDFLNLYPQTYGAYPGTTSSIPESNIYREEPFNRFVSTYANISYDYKDKYSIYSSVRRDGANVFGVNSNNRWKPLWSIGGKWQLSKEDFFQINWIQSLSIRTSFGYSGNVNNVESGKLTILYNSFSAPYTNLTHAIIQTAFNPNLRWEKVGQLNSGIDFEIFNGRFRGSVDVFLKKSTDLISNYPMDPTVGVSNYLINSASLRTTGFDFTGNARILKGSIQWNSKLGISYSKTIVTKIFNRSFRTADYIGYQIFPTEGRMAYPVISYRWAGLDPQTGDPLGYIGGKASNDYQQIASDSLENQKYHGSAIPLVTSFFVNTLSWKNVSVSFTITGRFNYYFRKPALNLTETGEIGGTNYTTDYLQRWQKPGDENFTTIPSVTYPPPSNSSSRSTFYRNSEIHVERGDNIRLQDIRLEYNWNLKIGNKFPIKSIQSFFYPNNLNIVIWRASKSNFDPDYSGGSGDPTAGPTPKTWTFGFNFIF